MYPTPVTDMNSLEACFDRMYKDYVKFCKDAGGSEQVIMGKEEWLDTLSVLDKKVLARMIYSFNSRELAVSYN